MQVRLFDYSDLTEKDFDLIYSSSRQLSIYDQLWYIAPLSDFKVKIFVFGDFETFLFIPYRSKLKVTYAYMPNFIQKLSFIGKDVGIERILIELQRQIKFGEISLVHEESRFDLIKQRINFKLNLQNSYGQLKDNFSDNHKRNISKSKHLEIRETRNIEDLILIFRKEKINVFSLESLNRIELDLNKLLLVQELKDSILILNAFDSNVVIASALFIHFNGILYYIIGCSIKSDSSVSSNGLFKIFDFVINRFSESKTILDFEGSDIPGIARFFKGFGSSEEKYYFVKWNRLPFPLNKFKK